MEWFSESEARAGGYLDQVQGLLAQVAVLPPCRCHLELTP